MIELTPLDVRKKRGDFRRVMRGFDPAEVDSFIELVAERMESLVKEVMTLKERAARLTDQVREQGDREKAVQDALVTAQELRKDISGQAQREAELMKREAENEIERLLLDAELRAEELRTAAVELERRRRRFLRDYRQYLERELDDVGREESRHPLDEKPLELELAEPPGEPVDGTGDGSGEEPASEPSADTADSRVPEDSRDSSVPEAAVSVEALAPEDSDRKVDGPASDSAETYSAESDAAEPGEVERDGADQVDEPLPPRVPVRSDVFGDTSGGGG